MASGTLMKSPAADMTPKPPVPLEAWGPLLEEWRAARQDVFDNTFASNDQGGRFDRLGKAEHALMDFARAVKLEVKVIE